MYLTEATKPNIETKAVVVNTKKYIFARRISSLLIEKIILSRSLSILISCIRKWSAFWCTPFYTLPHPTLFEYVLSAVMMQFLYDIGSLLYEVVFSKIYLFHRKSYRSCVSMSKPLDTEDLFGVEDFQHT